MSSTMFERSERRKILDAILRMAKVGDLLTYETLSARLGVGDVRREAKDVLNRAVRAAEREGVLFVTEVGRGLLRANGDEVVDDAGRRNESTRRRSGRTVRRLVALDPATVRPEKRPRLYVEEAKAALAHTVLGPRTDRRLTEAAKTAKEPMKIGDVLNYVRGLSHGE